LGDLGEGGHNSGIGLNLLEGDSVLDHQAGGLGELDEGAGSAGDTGSNIDGVIDGVDGLVEGNGVLVEDGGFLSSDGVDEFQVLVGLDVEFLSLSEGGASLSFSDGANSELNVGSSQGVGGVENLLSSVCDF